VWFQPPQNWLAQRLYNENSKETAKETNENRKWNWKRNRNKTESDPINKNEPWTDKLKMNWLTAQTNWIISKWASPKKVTAGWARRDVICRALCCLFLIFEQRSYCPASISRTSWPPTPAKTNSGTLTCYNGHSQLGPKKIVNALYMTSDISLVQWRARNFAHIGHFTDLILLKWDTYWRQFRDSLGETSVMITYIMRIPPHYWL
jgi:hypothetical protein